MEKETWVDVTEPKGDDDGKTVYLHQRMEADRLLIVMVTDEGKFLGSYDGGGTWIPLYPINKKRRINLMTAIFIIQAIIFIFLVATRAI